MDPRPAPNVLPAKPAEVPANLSVEDADDFGSLGGTFSAWYLWYYRATGLGPVYTGSYAHNHFVMDNSPGAGRTTHAYPRKYYWSSTLVRDRSEIPVLTDSTWAESANVDPNTAPPQSEAGPQLGENAFNSCINRHNGSINALFLDSSVKKIGLKQLWTLKWHRQFDTKGPWTTAGGVQNEHWPKWMRQYKDY